MYPSRTKGHSFRGTTSIRRALLLRRSQSRTRSGPRPSSGSRCNGLTRASLLACKTESCTRSLAGTIRATFGAGPLRRLSAGDRSFSVSAPASADSPHPRAYSSRRNRISLGLLSLVYWFCGPLSSSFLRVSTRCPAGIGRCSWPLPGPPLPVCPRPQRILRHPRLLAPGQ
jgi:hypothetical protein